MNLQLDIEDMLGVRARHTDPASSAMADAEHKASGKRERNLDRVLRLIARHPGMTTRELSAVSEFDRGGRPAVAWMLTERGRGALR